MLVRDMTYLQKACHLPNGSSIQSRFKRNGEKLLYLGFESSCSI